MRLLYVKERIKNGDFNVEDKYVGGREKIFKDDELAELLDEDPYQIERELSESLGVSQKAISKRLKRIGMIPKEI